MAEQLLPLLAQCDDFCFGAAQIDPNTHKTLLIILIINRVEARFPISNASDATIRYHAR
ncbi:hypothetical protein OUHCRE13_29820 [Enterobacter roggenkampii]|nr:hypothetical protein R1TS_09290 [Enterobacter cloacae]GJJ97382.1 hypothetical protein TUM16655_08320 [Enterobacter cloacae]GJK12416.1 hypothetical protein TUM16664_01880 [Enterobacter cloacae]